MASLPSETAATTIVKANDVGEYNHLAMEKKRNWGFILLRLVASFATASATLVMALNKETKSIVLLPLLGLILLLPLYLLISITLLPLSNGMATLHNWMMIALHIFGPKFHFNGFRLPIISILDMTTVALASAGDGAATFMAALGKNGNKHARWNKICDKFSTYCDHGAGALIASFVGLCLLLLISAISIIKPLHKSNNSFASP
ncbi:hypothetical protein IC582_028933 [Cucumis melo]